MGTDQPTSILLVEDEVLIAMQESKTLKKYGYHVVTAYSAKKAIEAVARENIDLILMDIDLGKGRMDGTRCAETILRNHTLPIIFLTSHAEEAMVEKVKGITRYGYVLKNAGEFVLVESIQMALALFDAYREIQEKERQLELAVDASDHAYWDLDIDTGKTYFSPRYYTMLGYHPGELPMDLAIWEELLHPDDRAHLVPRIFKKVDNVEPFNEEFRMKTKDGSWKWIRGSGKSYQVDEQGIPHRVVGTHEDITKQKKAEELHRESKEFYESILETVHEGIWVSDRNDRIVYVNTSMAATVGIGKDEIVGKHVLRDFPRATIREFKQYYSCAKNTLENVEYEAKVTTPKGKDTVQKGWLYPKVADGCYDGMICTIQDITASRQNELALKKSEKTYRSLFELAPCGIGTVSPFGYIRSVNRAFLELCGFEEKDFVGKHFTQIPTLLRQDFSDYLQIFSNIVKKNENRRFTFQWRHKSGEVRSAEARMKKVHVEGESPVIQCIVEDITEREAMIAQLQRSNEEKDILMKELNHRIKNNLSMISSLLSLKASTLGGSVDLSDIRHRIDAVRIIHEKLYKSTNIVSVKIDEYIEEIIDTVFSSFSPSPVTIETDMEGLSVPTKEAVSVGLIINELAVNAIKHGFIEGKTMIFFVSVQKKESANQWELVVSNTGRPFPETIDTDNPVTLGLRVISTLIKQLEGNMVIKRTPHPEFTITLPIYSEIDGN